VFDGFLDGRKAQTASRNLFIAFQLLKGLENQLMILLGYSWAIVLDLECDGRAFVPPPYEDGAIGAIMVLHGVVDEIAQNEVERRFRRQQ
jgi:hypothetical protein